MWGAGKVGKDWRQVWLPVKETNKEERNEGEIKRRGKNTGKEESNMS